MDKSHEEKLFEQVRDLPDPDFQCRFDRLVGVDKVKERLAKTISIILNPHGLIAWAKKHGYETSGLGDIVLRRPPLIILAGDVGCGKTEIAETIGDLVARNEKMTLHLYSMSLSSRGEGRVGEMTQLISSAFDVIASRAQKLKQHAGKHTGGIILIIDEADALAQSREAAQMHHEDRAGVNALIRGIDRLGTSGLPVVTIMCTNRAGSLDPAIRRRAADIVSFNRPNDDQRREILNRWLAPCGISSSDIAKLTQLTGELAERAYGFTFSDLTQRFIPAVLLDAYPSQALSGESAIRVCSALQPTPPFQEHQV